MKLTKPPNEKGKGGARAGLADRGEKKGASALNCTVHNDKGAQVRTCITSDSVDR